MQFSFLLVLVTVAFALAETSVVSLFLPDLNERPQPLEGSIVAEGDGTTTYSINCVKTVNISDCEFFFPGLLYTAGPTTVEHGFNPPYDRYGTPVCSVDGTTSAFCTSKMSVTGDITPYPETITLEKGRFASTRVTITASPTQSATGASVTKTEESPKDHQRWGI